jgi:hypothetical protein
MLPGLESALFKDLGTCLRLKQGSPMKLGLFKHGKRVNLKQPGTTLGIGRIEAAAWWAAAAKRHFGRIVVTCMVHRFRRAAAAGAGAAETPRSPSINSTRCDSKRDQGQHNRKTVQCFHIIGKFNINILRSSILI